MFSYTDIAVKTVTLINLGKGSITLLDHHCKTLDLQNNKVKQDKSRKL